MSRQPPHPKIYHITHMERLPQILLTGRLLSDSAINVQIGSTASIGMSNIKHRRREELVVSCHPTTKVGDYVPFYFCPRSIMLYVIHRANHPELSYRGGQEPIIHLEADLLAVIDWATRHHVRWAFSTGNAGARYAEFYSSTEDLGRLDWDFIAATDFRDPFVKEGKQAEFLVHEAFPIDLVERIGVYSEAVKGDVLSAVSSTDYTPKVETRRDWYY